ncbi:hypothetical protein J7E24_17030 [Hymenobacter sp. ISL-91]|uniref:carboxypeptidase-like regulatory domain-containing protein n=1 Tax=Hymenobacter sp. ISL-91 TaxID=2819151 RepID=UPI001BE61095|nr:carboxypeptidase-like regulatory domain-containing protein [Hymenobacter sp. ISL-91]MBT2559493.1 hypothetical protein [Hymenobacter sp. ISL-91]
MPHCKFLSISAALLVLSSCAKDSGPTLVAGQVVDQVTGQPVAGTTVQVEQRKRGSSGGGYSAIGPVYPTDGQGRFSFRFEAESEPNYIVRASSALGYFTDWSRAPDLKPGRKNEQVRVPVLAPAWVRIQLVDEPPKSRIQLSITGYSGSGEQLRYTRDTTFIRTISAQYTKVISWGIINEQGIITQSRQNINAASLDTVNVRIVF